jgi:hypothetical protein
MTDRQTPGIHEIINRWIEVGGTLELSDPTKWWAQYHSDVQFTNEPEDWMLELADKQGANLEYLVEQLRFINTPEEFLTMDPIFEVKPVKPLLVRSVIIDGEESTYLPAATDLEADRAEDPTRLEVYKGKKDAAKLVDDIVKTVGADPSVQDAILDEVLTLAEPKGKEKDVAETNEKKANKTQSNGKASSQPRGKQTAKSAKGNNPSHPNLGGKNPTRKGKPTKPKQRARSKPVPKQDSGTASKVSDPPGASSKLKPGRSYKDALQLPNGVGDKKEHPRDDREPGPKADGAANANNPPPPSDKQSHGSGGEQDVKTSTNLG